MNGLLLALLLALGCCAAGCRHAPLAASPDAVASGTCAKQNLPDYGTSAYVVRHGWHTGLVLPEAARFAEAWPDAERFAEFRFVEVGWGDAAFYQAAWPWPWVVLPAAAWPTPSTLHVTGFHQPVESYFAHSEVVEIPLTVEQCLALCQFIADSCHCDALGHAEILSSSRYGSGFFFRGAESYVVPKTCNTWTARALEAAGLSIEPLFCTLPPGVLWPARAIGQQTRCATNLLPVFYPFLGFQAPQ